MSFDGNFSCDAALRRFLARCPDLQSHPRLAALAQKGGALTADDVVDVIADPFLHPSYTIPIMGCFRPLNRRIAGRAVARLRLVPSLNLETVGDYEEIGDDDPLVIDFYLRRGRTLRLHELASLAFCRALDLAPFLLKYVLSYFDFSPPPFGRLSMEVAPQFIEKDVKYLLYAVRGSYRLLLMEPKVFSELWDWSCFLDLVERIAAFDFGGPAANLNDILDIRWCGIQILSVVLKISDRATQNFGMGMDEAFLCLLRWEEFCKDTSLEKVGLYCQATEMENTSSLDGIVNFSYCLESFDNNSSSITHSNSDEVVLERRKRKNMVSGDLRLSGNPFILTSTLKKSFEMVMMAVSQKWPILLHGPAGAGKTALINYLADISGNQVLFIFMDEQMDSKTLIGTYICTEQPGEFRWQPGSLTQALLNGLWVVFEDIDKAPNEVHSIILPLLEGSSSFATGHGEVINVCENFRLFATISTSMHESWKDTEGKFFSVLWRKVIVRIPGGEDLVIIINTWYPSLKEFSTRLVETFEKVNSLASCQIGIFSRFSLRDLLKWCKRISGLGISPSGLPLPVAYRQNIYQEAVDIFAASSSSLDKRLLTMSEIAKMWAVTPPEPENLYPPNKPVIQKLRSDLQVGRIRLQCTQTEVFEYRRPFVGIRSSLHVLERIACSVKYNEPVLLVGETGTGKTTLVQNLAARLGQPLIVMNLSQQSDIADLLGGFKPTDACSICMPLYREFNPLFCKTFSLEANKALADYFETYAMMKKWKKLLHAYKKTVDFVLEHGYKIGELGSSSKRKRPLSGVVRDEWESFSWRLETARRQISASAGMSFKFVEGAFITALRNGHWILLDEVNLAPPETLHRIIGVLDGEKGTLCLSERGDVDYIYRHPHFRLFACMNPATDAGKRELPYSFRSRFTEYFVDDVMDDEDLILFVNQYMDGIYSIRDLQSRIVLFYKTAKRESEESLQDGANQKPQFSLRSLARALEYTKMAEKNFGLQKALYDGFCMFFLTSLDGPSAKIMNNMIQNCLLDKRMPPDVPFDGYLDKLQIQNVSGSDAFVENYVLTRSVKDHLKNLARAVYVKRYPVLLQGPTSSGKTSLVQYLASVTGHEFVRINNHEHTDLQEYFGSYITDSHGRLKFQEGVLVKAVREGHWIVLDELNLAPSDVLEALNRLLDDNRELFVPELQETVPAHPDFMLFATQNPPALYGGRKMLSRAFRNRFLEIHVDEIPEDELTTILEKRCKIPASYAMKMVEVMKDLQLHRQNSKIFAGKHGFITPRDLFRWANRFRTFGKSYEDLAKDGYLLLAERLREENERKIVQETFERRLRVKLKMDDLYKEDSGQDEADFEFARCRGFQNIIWTKNMQRLYFLVKRCYELREPVLLVGETGGGKTSVCQLLSAVLDTNLHILNCHQYTETSDFLGGFRPLRDRSKLAIEFKNLIGRLKLSKYFLHIAGEEVLSFDISEASFTLNKLNVIEQHMALNSYVTQQDFDDFRQVKLGLMQLQQKWQTIFLWQDGPLVQAMKDGHLFLVDEISLADDSVLERLNSILEPERKLSLAEKGGSVLEKITAHPNFFILATMNPGGDFGKKELSPALRNRFTEIWVSPVSDIDELKRIALQSLKPELFRFTDILLKFWQRFSQLQTGRMLTVRDLLNWISFINETEGRLGAAYAFIHGVFLVLLDGLSLGTDISKTDAKKLREAAFSFLLEEIKVADSRLEISCLSKMENYGWGDAMKHADTLYSNDSTNIFGIKPFYFNKGCNDCKQDGFEFLAPTTCRNALRVLRAMQLPKPVLLEGSPGVGKTSLVVALAEYSGHTVVRINLSEQTDMMDLLGSDLPFEGDNGIEFCWSDGILLQALKNGSWVLLDELNLAPQSVLEGLNSILDHRAEIFIPELGQTYKCPDSFRVFACQNPSCQGGGRKGLPKSLLNRFTKVYVDELTAEDYLSICQSRHPIIPEELLLKLISFNRRLYEDTMISRRYGQEGSPWEFNLRDVIRSCQIIEGAPKEGKLNSFLTTVYLQRMRTADDRKEVLKLFESVFGVKPYISRSPHFHISPQYLIVGSACVGRSHYQPIKISKGQINMLPGIFHNLEAAVHCIQQRWLCILVGPYSSGKTSLIRLLAQLTGNALNELNLSSGTDVSELLGCFEQYNHYRRFKIVTSQVERFVDEYFSLRLEMEWKDLIIERKSLFAKWFGFLATKMSIHAFEESYRSGLCSALMPLIEIIEQLKDDLEKFHLPMSWSYEHLNTALKTVLDLQKSKIMQPSAKFEWVTSNLIKAVEYGEWVVLDNANLCNPTVLDRINSLVEPEGSIMLNECGLVDGKPVKLNAHPNFRLFLTVDPKHGEVSRAMRNRGVEIYMMQPNWLPNGVGHHACQDNDVLFTADAKHCEVSRVMLDGGPEMYLSEPKWQVNDEGHRVFEDSEVNDVKRFLILSGIPIIKMVMTMTDAHMNAKAAGLRLGLRVTLLELGRWVQLFQLLLISGNQPKWSLQLSWEHTYMSLLGEFEGCDTLMQALSDSELYNLNPLSGCSLSLPGGWPVPHTLRNFMSYSREACVKRNCMYLEFLGGQCASYELRSTWNFPLNRTIKFPPSTIPKDILYNFLFPRTLDLHKSSELAKFDLALANQMLFIAANWTIEQATESDLALYIQWFKWYSSQFQPYCRFFESFLAILEQAICHPIWNYILDCRRELLSYYKIDVNMRSLPLLSSNLAEMGCLDGSLKKCKERLDNALHCVSLLRLTYQQWNSEEGYPSSALSSLRCLEREALKEIVESQDLLHIYSNILEHHIFFWKLAQHGDQIQAGKGITSSQIDYMLITWSSIKKEAAKLQHVFPEAVGELLEQDLNLGNSLAWSPHNEKPTLWVHGGHPFLPSSANIYHKVQQLLSFCNEIWPRNIHMKVNAILSTNAGLRYLAMRGLCMSSYIATGNGEDVANIVHQLEEIYQVNYRPILEYQNFATGSGEDDANIVHQLEEIYQMLSSRFENERKNLDFMSKINSNAPSVGWSVSACCAFSPEMLFRQSGFDSWVVTLPLFNKKSFSLDIKLLQELTRSTSIDATEAYQVMSKTTHLLQHALEYSMNFSSRSPVDFLPHQTILWILDACNSLDSVNAKVVSSVLEMWFKWHSSLWNFCSGTLKKFSRSGYDEACHLVPLTRTAILDHICHGSICIKDYDMRCLKLRVAAQNLWEDAPSSFIGDLRSAAHSLFKQIIFVHKRLFKEHERVMPILCQLMEKGIKPEQVQILRQNISRSSNRVLVSLIDLIAKVIEVLAEDTDLNCPSYGSLYNLGCAWLYIGVLRFHLLLYQNGTDPAMKYALKHSQIEEKISLLKLEIKVRRECEHLAGKSSTIDDEKQRVSLLGKLEMERKRLKRKVVYRPEPPKYKSLRSVCGDFMEFGSCMELVKNLKCNKGLSEIIDEACNWQVTATSFINRLTEEFEEYIDVIQPIQVAVYEMKLGLSIALSSAVEREYLRKVQEKDIGSISATIHSLMQFPRTLANRYSLIDQNNKEPNFIYYESIRVIDINLLKKLITVSSDIHLDKAVSLTIPHINLIHVAHHVCNSLLMDKASFLLLDEAFSHFAKLWLAMKIKAKEDGEAQCYEFRPRSIKIEEIFEGDLCQLSKSDSDGSLTSDCEEMLMEQEFTVVKKYDKMGEFTDDDLTLILESILKRVVSTHNELFGSSDLVKQPGISHISDDDRMHSFVDSYKLGARIMHGDLSFWLPFSSLDDCLMPEHLLYVCLQYEQTLSRPHQQTHVHNIYKDSMASEMFEMVKPLTNIQERVRCLLDELPDHPGLQKLFDLTDMLLAIPSYAPLSKALFGLQVLVSKAQLLQECSSKFSLEDQLQSIYKLVFLWQKWGVDCWPALLDDVQKQYEINTGELWCLLLPVLLGSNNDEVIHSVEKFIQTSNIGEFKKRLQILLAFHGQLNCGICLKAYSSSHMQENLNILYNAFGYYVQFLPLVMEHIMTGRRSIEKDLEEYQKLFHWGHHDNYSSIENFRRIRQKIWKLVQKFNDNLQQPFMTILNQDASLNREKVPAWLEQKISDDTRIDVLQFPLDLGQLCEKERFLWYGDWRETTNSALQKICCEGFAGIIRKPPSLESSCEKLRTVWEEGWTCLEKICKNSSDLGHLWKHATKKLMKRRALGELFENLESCGLSKHRSELDLESGQSSSLFLQRSYNVLHLLQQEFCPPYKGDNCASKWEIANRYYFKNLAIMKQIDEIRQCFNKDLSFEQVTQATSFIYHLISIQQDQRYVVYRASEQLKKLRQLLNGIGIDNNYHMAPNQHAIFKCMWQQKQLFDSLLAMSKDMRLLLGIIKNNHLDTCNKHLDTCNKVNVEADNEADKILVHINKFEPIFKKSKESLDKFLLGCNEYVAMSTTCMPLVVSDEMKQYVMLNFKVIDDFEVDIKTLCSQKDFMISMKETLLDRFQDFIIKGKEIMKEFESESMAIDQSIYEEDLFLIETKKLLMDVSEKLCKLCRGCTYVGEVSTENISLWKDIFESHMEALHLDHIYDAVSKKIVTAISQSKLGRVSANKKTEVEMHLRQLHGLLDLLTTFGESILVEFLDLHKSMAEMTHVLAQLFALLFCKGFGTAEDSIENTICDRPEDASGTGMGEGEGVNDVSDQLVDEAQLNGTSEMQEGLDGSDKVPSKDDRGIEMGEDFAAETFSVSEDSEANDTEDEENMNLESKMGESTDGNQVVDEKLWDKEEDGSPNNPLEKYESGPSVQETDTSSRELRAKDDNALTEEESGTMDNDESDRLSEDKKSDTAADDDNISDMKLDKFNAYENPSDIQLDEQERGSEYVNMDGAQGSDILDEDESGSAESDMEVNDTNEKFDSTDNMDDQTNMHVDENAQNKDEGEDAENSNMDFESNKETFESDKMESLEYPAQNEDSSEHMSNPNRVDSSMELEMNWSNSIDINNSLAPSRCQPSDEIPVMDLSMPDSRNGSQFAPDKPKPQTSHGEVSSLRKTQTNPYRSLGDAMEEWKERVKVSVDPQEHESQIPDDIEDDDADEYRYISEKEKGSSQALGAAATDQIKNNIEGKKSSTDEEDIRKKDDVDRMDAMEENSEACSHKTWQASNPSHKVDEELQGTVVGNDESVEDSPWGDPSSSLGDMISIKTTYINENLLLPTTLKSNEELVKSSGIDDVSDDDKQKSISDWRKYELITARLSQELTEQLRLVMEPTLASKLQGDYKTGKRINMKKVIPYIASHFRKDKIWLRRTRPNKRDYQVVVAVDDSRSMSEGHCGNFAIEALVTVCRAMSQLEVGQFAVASFGEKGNIKLLHDFDQPLTGEAGGKMISSLSFNQDNTIANEPMVDLLMYLNTMLDAAVGRSRTPSGQNPLHQLILIIADGRFHDKEKLKHRIRDVLNRRRMIAFILLDSPQESIMDLMEVSFEGQTPSFTKYLNSFPFPYYIVLKNIEALPRTLANLLRQWFELMQNMSE